MAKLHGGMMARYDYKCTECGTTFEIEHPMSAHPKVSCPSCGAPAERIFDTYGIEFKGTGYYNTDQKDKK
jgi:putative FmdB family regulatory protein